MKTSKVDPITISGHARKGYEDVFFYEHFHEALPAVDLALATHGLEIERFPDAAINAEFFRIVKRKG